jgi:hypothetical protein
VRTADDLFYRARLSFAVMPGTGLNRDDVDRPASVVVNHHRRDVADSLRAAPRDPRAMQCGQKLVNASPPKTVVPTERSGGDHRSSIGSVGAALELNGSSGS